MKKTLFTIISFLLVFSLTFSSLATSNISTEEALNTEQTIVDTCYQIAEEVVTKYYYAQQTSEQVDFLDVFLYDILDDYLQITLDNSYFLAENDTLSDLKNILAAEYFSIDCSLLDYDISDNGIKIVIFAELAVEYPNMNTISYFGEIVNVLLIEYGNTYKIADIVFANKLEDEGETLDAEKWNIEKNAEEIHKLINDAEQININSQHTIENIEECITTLLDTSLVSGGSSSYSSEESVLATNSVYSFNRSAMVTYAKRTAPLKKSSDNKLYYNSSSARGSSEAPYYYDFSSFSGSYDCTNFISHCLLAGGAKMNQNGNPSTGWYFNNVNASGSTTRSYTWSSVNSFGSMIINNSGNGPRGEVVSYTNLAEIGDIIQFEYSDYNAGSYGHSTIITLEPYSDYLDNYTSETGPIVNAGITSRSSNTSYKVNQNLYRKICNLDSGNTVVGWRIIHLTGYAY